MTLAITTNIAPSGITALIGVASVTKTFTCGDAPLIQRPQTFAATGGADEAIDLGDITVATGFALEIVNTSADNLALSTGTGGSFSAMAIFAKAGMTTVIHANAVLYAKSAGAGTVTALIRAIEFTAP